jgi:2-polyprenyl-3-methyl-5-hydroxy-6-metoxy-1,4-benzoquinol methylase
MRTLEALAQEDPLNDWIFSRISPFLKGRILEVGCGIGTFTKRLVDRGTVVAVDPWPEAVEICRERLGDKAEVLVGHLEDLSSTLKPGFGALVCLNVIEHIEDDVTALKHMTELLAAGGHLLLLTPSEKWLFGSLDEAFGHYRRYRKSEFRDLLMQAGLEIVDLRHFNFLGILGWWIAGKILRVKEMKRNHLRIYRMLLPPFRWIEDRLRLPIGLSLIAVARKA